jgi:UDP-3-O-[3-hydroxymyristoyl] glucosamine N-acyltransferase
MALTVAQLAHACGATLHGGDPSRIVRAAGNLQDARSDQVAYLSDPRYAEHLSGTQAAAVFLKMGAEHPAPPETTAILFHPDPDMAFLVALKLFHPETPEIPGVDSRACVEDGARVHPTAYVGAFAVVRAGAEVGEGCWILSGAYVGRGCKLGRGCRLYPHAVLYDGVELGADVIIHAGTVIGADGFGYKFRGGRHVKVPQVGTVRVDAQAEIGANSAIDRAALGVTVVGEGTKIDNLVQVGHGAKLGKHVILCGQAGLAGSTELKDYAVLGANAGVADHLTIGMGAKIGAKSGVAQDVPSGAEVWGLPASERRTAWRQIAAIRKLPDLLERIRELEARIAELEKKSPPADKTED